MRLKRLELDAFGPFTGQTLSFDTAEPGLHLIYGANEAGKSSSLRGLRALLYGFPAQTPDNFLHPYEQLLVSGCLEDSDGRELSFQRRKRRIGDLLDRDGAPLEANSLNAFLQGVEPEIFASLYGIDHRRLVEGGADILSQKGEVGQALFAAGAGLSSLQAVIDEFEREAADLFKATGQLPEINRAVKRFKDLKREMGEASLSAREWKDLQDDLSEAEARRASLERERQRENAELRRLERLEQAIPELGALAVERERLCALGEVAPLPSDFAERYRRLDTLIRDTKKKLHETLEKLRHLEDRRQAISVHTKLLQQAELVDDFQQRLGEYRKGQKDKPERNGMRIALRQEAAHLLRQVRPDLPLEQVDSLRPLLARKKTIQALGARFEVVKEQVRQADRQVRAAETQLEEVTRAGAALPEPRDGGGLAQALALARRSGELDSQLATHRDEVERAIGECRAELHRIGLWTGEPAEIPALPLPLSETVHQFDQQFGAIIETRTTLDQERRNDARELNARQAELDRITMTRDLPSERELSRIRERRDEGWELLRRQWLAGEDVAAESRAFDRERPLPAAYEELVRLADLLADRLRHEADRVAGAASLRSRIAALHESLSACDSRLAELDSREEALAASWKAAWEPAGIDPLTPREMSEWLTAMDRLGFRVRELHKQEEETARMEARRVRLCDQLRQELGAVGADGGPAGGELDPLLVFAERLLEEIEDEHGARRHLQERQKQADRELKEARQNLLDAEQSSRDWQDSWDTAIAGLGLGSDISPPEAHDYLENLQDCLAKVREADDLQKRIDGIDRDAEEFAREVADLFRRVGFGELTGPLDQAVLTLRTALDRARGDQSRAEQLREDRDALINDRGILEQTLRDGEEEMSTLMRIGSCSQPDELATTIDRFEEHRQIRHKIEAIEGTLARIGGGATVDELSEQAAAVDGDELPGQISKLRHDIEARLNPEIIQLSQKIGEIGGRLQNMDGGAGAADAKEKMEQELARIGRLTERYITLKLASRILRQEIERYREEHQGPVLQIASRYFAGLTVNSFTELRVDVDDRGDPVLVGIRPDGRSIGVAGMSDGTRDQLYLALRLATLEWRLEKSEPMPFIVDDILVNFDDERSRAALGALAELSRKNQVIVFTHHRQIVAQAEALETPAEIVIHRLPAAAQPPQINSPPE